MPFKPGESGNPLGKPKGTKGKLSTKVKEALAAALEGELENIQELLNQLEPKERIDVIAKLLPYIAPKLAAQTISVDAEIKEKKRPEWFFEN
jgi:hypothetical protein